MKKSALFFLILQAQVSSSGFAQTTQIQTHSQTPPLIQNQVHIPTNSREIEYMSEILPSITQDSLVIFDLDKTVVETFPIEPTEPSTPSLIQDLQNRGIHVMALTLRYPILAEFTQKSLESLGVDLNLQPPSYEDFYIGNSESAYYTKGIAYIGPSGNKGEALVKFLQQINQMPSRIIFVDDTLQNIIDVENALANYPYEHISFHYNYDVYHRIQLQDHTVYSGRSIIKDTEADPRYFR